MAVRRNTRTRASDPASKPARMNRAKAAPAPVAKRKDVTEYAEKPATPYHKAFATWIIKEVGLDLTGMTAKQAFLKGVSIATAARPSFNESDFIAEWRERTGETKRGPKPATEKEAPKARRRKPEPEPEPEDDTSDEDDVDWGDSEDDDVEFDDSDEDDDDEDDDEDDEFDDDEFDDEDEEPAPAPKRNARQSGGNARTGSKSRTATTPANKRAPSKATAKAKAADDDDFLF